MLTCLSTQIGLFVAAPVATADSQLPGSAAQASVSSATGWVVPVAVIVAVLLLLVLAIIVWRIRRQRSMVFESLPGTIDGRYSGQGKTAEEVAFEKIRNQLASVDISNPDKIREVFIQAAEDFESQVRVHMDSSSEQRSIRRKESLRLANLAGSGPVDAQFMANPIFDNAQTYDELNLAAASSGVYASSEQTSNSIRNSDGTYAESFTVSNNQYTGVVARNSESDYDTVGSEVGSGRDPYATLADDEEREAAQAPAGVVAEGGYSFLRDRSESFSVDI
jgi:hypothetical protein